MKMKTIFLSMLAVATLASCNKDDDGMETTAVKSNFEVTLPGAPGTYAVEDTYLAGQITPLYNDVTTYLVNVDGFGVKEVWTDAEIAAKKKSFEQIVKPAKVIVVVNAGNVTLPDLFKGTELEDALQALTIANQNLLLKNLGDADTKGNAAGDYSSVQQVTLYGEQGNFTTGTPHEGHEVFEAEVTLKSLVSRFEVGTVKAGTGLKNLAVDAVYINYFYNTNNETGASTEYTSADWAEPYDPTWATDGGSVDVTSGDKTKAYAYQVFAGNLVPHIIYKVSGTVAEGSKLADGTTGSFSGKYITVKGFKVDGTTSLTALEAHKIYKMGLTDGGIEISAEQITSEPETVKVDLVVTIKVADWTVQTVTPEI